jgi:hypothetical protein
VVDSLDTRGLPIKLTNLENDRIYLGSKYGTLLCLREIPAVQPVLHLLPEEKTAPTTKQEAAMGEMPPADAGFGQP